jgi:hypothetical protein
VFTGCDDEMFIEFKALMKQESNITDLGKMNFFLGVEVMQNDEGICLSQKKYALEISERFGLENANSVCNPMVPVMKLMKNKESFEVCEGINGLENLILKGSCK